MDEILRIILKEKSQLEEHKRHGELTEYGPNMSDDLIRSFNRIIQIASKGAEQDAA